MNEPLYRELKDEIARRWMHHIYLMAHQYQYGWSQIITGMPGSGKTMTAVTLAELLSVRDFTPENVAFTPGEYLDTLNDCKIGDCLVWSELGSSFSARQWYKLSNILIGEVVQTMRIKKPIIFMDAPDLSFVDIQARKLVFNFSECKRSAQNPPKLWVYNIRINRRTGDIYFPHPIIKTTNEGMIKLRSITLKRKPSEELWDEIDKKQRKFKEKIEEKARKTINFLEKEELESEETIYDQINKISTNIERYKNKYGRIDWHLIKLDLKVSEPRAKEIKAFLEREEKKGG